MAIQNFISGGFYGKLGEVVGQRWRNKRTIRRYVIGANPQTPAQQANRALFASAVRLAQQALNVNKGAPAWANQSLGEFSWRVGTAKLRLRNGLPEGQAVPIFPDGYIPFHTFESATIQSMEAYGRAVWKLTPVPPVPDRVLSGCFHCRNLLTGEWEDIYSTATLPSTTPLIYDPGIPAKYGFPAGAWLEGATLYDESFSNNAYFLPRLFTAEPDPITRFYDLEFVHIDISNSYIDIYYYCPFIPFEEIPPIPVDAWCLVDGDWQNYENIGQLRWMEEHDWQINIAIPGNVKFPADSSIYSIETEIEREYYNQYVICPSYDFEE